MRLAGVSTLYCCLTQNVQSVGSHPAAMKVFFWLTSGETVTLLDPGEFAKKTIMRLKSRLQTLIKASSYEQRLFLEKGSVELHDDDVIDPTVETFWLVVSSVSLQDIVDFRVVSQPCEFWEGQAGNPTEMKAYGRSFEVVLTLQSGQIHRPVATYQGDFPSGAGLASFGLQDWPLMLRMFPIADDIDDCDRKREKAFRDMRATYEACPDHVPFPVGLQVAKISGQAFLSEKTSSILLIEDVGESLRSRCASLDVMLDAVGSRCYEWTMMESLLKQWLCEIVAMTEETHRNQLFWYDEGFNASSICWNERTKRWYLTQGGIKSRGRQRLTFQTSWVEAVQNFKRETFKQIRWDRVQTIFVDFMDQILLHPCEPITANGLRRKFGMITT